MKIEYLRPGQLRPGDRVLDSRGTEFRTAVQVRRDDGDVVISFTDGPDEWRVSDTTMVTAVRPEPGERLMADFELVCTHGADCLVHPEIQAVHGIMDEPEEIAEKLALQMPPEVAELVSHISAGLSCDFTRWMEAAGFLVGGRRNSEVTDMKVVRLMAEAWLAGHTTRSTL
jgi:hypothetical protein